MSDVLSQNAEDQPAPPDCLQVGDAIGSYRVTRKIGEGGMGSVYIAEQVQIGFRAAIKVLHPEYSRHPEIARRFLNEARAVNIIQHPGVVKIFEFGRLPDQTAYIIMEYLDGEVLNRRLERLGGRMRVPDALRLGRQVASALAAAHARDVVHRDLKPANIILVPDPEAEGRERAKVLDFGLAKVAEPLRGPPRATRTGVVLGTAMYMAPEQCRGARDVDGRADVYALGVLIYEMISGRPPFMADSEGELVTMQLRDPPPALRELMPTVPEEVAELVHSLLCKDPADRPEMAQVADVLERLGSSRDSLPVRAPSLPPHAPAKVALSVPPIPPRSLSGPQELTEAVPPSDPSRPRALTGLRLSLGLVAATAILAMSVALLLWHRSAEAPDGVWGVINSTTPYHLRALYYDGTDSLWAVGDNGVILHGREGRWASVPSGTSHGLRGVWGTGPGDVWAVGGQGTALRWDGRAWRETTKATAISLRGVWGSSPNDVWAVGEQGVIQHWDGRHWEQVPSGVSEDFRAVWGSHARDIWAVGEYGLIVRWDGTAWTRSKSGTVSRMAKVWGLSPTDVWAVGNEGTILHFDGTAWSKQPTPTGEELSAVFGRTSDDVWVVGNSGTILHRVNNTWRLVTGAKTKNWLYGIWGGSGADDLWVVGAYGTVLWHRR